MLSCREPPRLSRCASPAVRGEGEPGCRRPRAGSTVLGLRNAEFKCDNSLVLSH